MRGPRRGCWPLSQTSAVEEQNARLARSLAAPVRQILAEEKIETSSKIMDVLQCLHIPLCRWLVDKQSERPLVLGINGAQGSGKSTLSRIVGLILEQGFHKRVVNISIDDLYKTRSQRVRLAEERHPLLATRGVPGSHDVELGRLIIKQLVSADTGQLAIPRFDKATDDRRPEKDWTMINTECDLVILASCPFGELNRNC